ncbi:hypothetical protein TIFTF001_039747 [Ficus carica]|uniref:Uncharacterized protein n=1 Tax=Ficus carica TaxID=3494 RepID=A0AA87YQG6_FICCA|nr:hypothetical protein TIFTF001_039747 [Ficus carica]
MFWHKFRGFMCIWCCNGIFGAAVPSILIRVSLVALQRATWSCSTTKLSVGEAQPGAAAGLLAPQHQSLGVDPCSNSSLWCQTWRCSTATSCSIDSFVLQQAF